MKVKYQIYTGRYSTDPKIYEVEFVSETDNYVKIVEDIGFNSTHLRRVAKTSDWKSYFDTREEAQAELVRRAEQRVSNYQLRLEDAKEFLEMVLKENP